ncbi:tetratricopeptide repeat protein [Brucella intermedia]|uniref:tetratricopeptide repeat protein n=1 Tax=Brucella intermedia TaxID=94625 RepID=UPI00236295AE|nr:hypothetical protein [Brucella intermedia]
MRFRRSITPLPLFLLLFAPFMLEACTTTKNEDPHLNTRVALGKLYLKNNELEKGSVVLDRISHEFPNSPEVILTLANAYYENGAYQKATFYFEKARILEQNRPTEPRFIFGSKSNNATEAQR